MKLFMLFEDKPDIGKGDYHTESQLAPIVAEYVNGTGIATWPDILDYVESSIDLTAFDKASAPGTSMPRWKKAVKNLHAHRTLEGGKFGDIVRIKGGFATKEAAEEAGIDIMQDNSIDPNNPGKRGARVIKHNTGQIAGQAYAEMGKPNLRDINATRAKIEQMIKADQFLSVEELKDQAKEIISQDAGL